MPAAEIAAAITSFRASLDIVKAMIGLRDEEAFRAKSIELQGTILQALEKSIEARDAYATQLDRIHALEAELANMKAWDAEKKNYELKTFGLGTMAYMLKPEARGTTPPHWLCPNCFERGQKSFCQPTAETAAGRRIFACHNCDGKILGQGMPHWID